MVVQARVLPNMTRRGRTTGCAPTSRRPTPTPENLESPAVSASPSPAATYNYSPLFGDKSIEIRPRAMLWSDQQIGYICSHDLFSPQIGNLKSATPSAVPRSPRAMKDLSPNPPTSGSPQLACRDASSGPMENLERNRMGRSGTSAKFTRAARRR